MFSVMSVHHSVHGWRVPCDHYPWWPIGLHPTGNSGPGSASPLPPPAKPEYAQTWTSPTGDSSLDIFKLVHYESHTVGKRAVCIRLECFLVIRIWTFRWQDNDPKDLCNFWCYRSLMVLECGVFPSFFRWDPSTSVWGSLILLVYCPGLHSWVFYDWSCKEEPLLEIVYRNRIYVTTPRNRNIHTKKLQVNHSTNSLWDLYDYHINPPDNGL